MSFRHTPFFILNIRNLLSVGLILFALMSQGSGEVGAMLINKKDVLELVITDNRLQKLGSWMFFMSNNVDNVNEKTIAGVKNIGHKIEGGRISRYIESYEDVWQDLGPAKIIKNDYWQTIIIPKSILFKQKGEGYSKGNIKWRLILFPHAHNNAVFIPAHKVGAIPLKGKLIAGQANEASMNFSYFYQSFDEEQDQLLKFKNGTIGGNVTESFNVVEHSIEKTFYHLNHNSLWWPNINSISLKNLSKENSKGTLIPSSINSIIFPSEKALNDKQTLWLNESRIKASHLSNRKAYLMIDAWKDFSNKADGLILSWENDLVEDIKLLDKTRKAFKGNLFVMMGKGFFKSDAQNIVLSMNVFLKNKVYPLLPPDENFKALSHENTVLHLWIKEHILQSVEHNKVYDKLYKIPKEVYHKSFLHKRRYSIPLYLNSLKNTLKEQFKNIENDKT